MCRNLIGASERLDRTHDAITPDGKRLEIKATGTMEGKTTISNSNEFDLLVWMFIDFDKDIVNIYELPRDFISLSGENRRKSISLGSIVKSRGINPTIYAFQHPIK